MMDEKKASDYACSYEDLKEEVRKLKEQVQTNSKSIANLANAMDAEPTPNPPRLTMTETNILRMLSKAYKWVAKDGDGCVCVYPTKPHYDEIDDEWYDDEDTFVTINIYGVAEFRELPTDETFLIESWFEDWWE